MCTYSRLTKLINNSNYLVPQMTRGNYKSIFENSFLSAGARINPKLVVTVLDDISDLTDPLASSSAYDDEDLFLLV